MTDHQPNIEDLLSENRVFPPSSAFVKRAIVSDPAVYERAESDPVGFWGSRPTG